MATPYTKSIPIIKYGKIVTDRQLIMDVKKDTVTVLDRLVRVLFKMGFYYRYQLFTTDFN
jgi:hypothetical protein